MVGFAFPFTPMTVVARSNSIARSMAASTESSTLTLQDNKGNDIQVGSIVKVSAEGLKAYQVNKKGQGSFVDGKFVPIGDDEGRKSKNLVLPVGMAGIVTKLYNTEEVSANFSVQAKFIPGKYNDDSGIDPPVAFLMHFATQEIEAV